MTLLERLQSGGSSRQADLEIAKMIYGIRLIQETVPYYYTDDTGRTVVAPHSSENGFVVSKSEGSWGHTKGHGWNEFSVPPFTSCLNAAITLVDSWAWGLEVAPWAENGGERMYQAMVGGRTAIASSPALALCIAYIMAQD